MFKHISRRHGNFTYLLLILLVTVIGGLLVYKEPTITGFATISSCGTTNGPGYFDLTANRNCGGFDVIAITFNKNDTEFNCAGFIVTGDGPNIRDTILLTDINDNFTIRNCKLKSGVNNLNLTSVNNSLVVDTNVSNGVASDISLRNSFNNTFINVTFRTMSLGANSNYTVMWYLGIQINLSNGTPVSNANVTAFNATIANFSGVTDNNGFLRLNVTHYINDSTAGVINYFTYRVNVSNGTTTNSTFVNVTNNTVVLITLANISAGGGVTNTPPYNITLLYPANNLQINNTNTINFNFTVYDNENATLNCTLLLDGVLNKTNINGLNGSSNYTNYTLIGIDYGSYNWSINCSDGQYSNISGVFFFSINDTLPPAITLNKPLNNSQINNTQTVSLNFTATDNRNTSFSCSLYLDSVLNATNSSVADGTETTINLALNYTAHNWSINCSDGLQTNVSYTYFFSINDTSPPSITLNNPINYYNSSTNSINFNFTAIDNKDVNISCNLTIDGVVNKTAIAAINGTPYNITVSNFGDGSYLWNVSCWDNSSNLNKSSTRNFTIDTVKPSITLNAPVDGYNSSSNTINFNWTVSDNLDVGLSCNITVDGNVNASDISSAHNTAVNYTISGFSDGTHKWNISCIDDVINTNFSITRNYTVDTTNPIITLLSPANNYNWVSSSSSTATFSYNVTDINISACYLVINNAVDQSDTAIEINATQSFSKSLGNAVHNWSINCTDWVSNKANSTTWNLTMSYSAPNTGGGGGGGGGGDTTIIGIPITKEETKEITKEQPKVETPKDETKEKEPDIQIPEEPLEDYIEQIIEIEYKEVEDKSVLEEKFKDKYWLARNNTNISIDSYYNETVNRTVITVMIKPNATLINYSIYIFMSKCMIEYVKHIVSTENLSARINSTSILFRGNLSVNIQDEDVQLKIPIGDLTETRTITFEVPDDIMIKGCEELYKILGVADKIIPLRKIEKEIEMLAPPKTLTESIRELFKGVKPAYIITGIAVIAIIAFLFKSKERFLSTEKGKKHKKRIK